MIEKGKAVLLVHELFSFNYDDLPFELFIRLFDEGKWFTRKRDEFRDLSDDELFKKVENKLYNELRRMIPPGAGDTLMAPASECEVKTYEGGNLSFLKNSKVCCTVMRTTWPIKSPLTFTLNA